MISDVPLWMIFGALLAGGLLLAWLSKDQVAQKLALLMMASWSISNLAVAMLGFTDAPLIIASADAVIATIVVMLGRATRNYTALLVFLFFGIEGCTHFVGFLTNTTNGYRYYNVLNEIFVAQVLVIGGSAAQTLFLRWRDGEPERPHHYGLGG